MIYQLTFDIELDSAYRSICPLSHAGKVFFIAYNHQTYSDSPVENLPRFCQRLQRIVPKAHSRNCIDVHQTLHPSVVLQPTSSVTVVYAQ